MKKGIGIISEFNIFHSGHKYLFDKIREKYDDKAIVCFMSGNFVQRGEFAVIEKYKRAEAAIKCGADIVLEIPFPFCTLSSEAYARAGITLLYKTGLCDTIAFGCENNDLSELEKVSRNLRSDDFICFFEEYCLNNKNIGFAAARENAYTELFGKTDILSNPNCILASEYIGEIISKNLPIEIYPVKRHKCGYSDMVPNDEYASATYIRKKIKSGEYESIKKYIPKASYDIFLNELKQNKAPVDIEKLFDTLIYKLRTIDREEAEKIYGFSQIYGRALKFSDGAVSISDLCEKIKSSKFTDSRIKRSIIALICGINKGIENNYPEYTLLLGASEKGRKLISAFKKEALIPVFTKPKHILESEDIKIRNAGEFAMKADSVYSICFPDTLENSYFLKKSPYIEK